MREALRELREALSGNFLVVCLGNELRGDDAVGKLVADALRDGGLGDRVVYLGTRPEDVARLVERGGYDRLLFIDAVEAGLSPGSLVVGEVEELEEPPARVTTHNVPLSLVVAYLRVLVPSLKAYLAGIQVRSTEVGSGISEEVARAGRELAAAILALARRSAGELSGGAGEVPDQGLRDQAEEGAEAGEGERQRHQVRG